ncbi:CDP-diacylglycerol--serine O-phosphatidyltransferase [Gemelliphila palaticanis]|uniref:CDP-diacylglycerol--serine O-phosphatidyltransferase n=1 Tax=Gemelliphila palaticanis TaxID=81950 RepID=A0ABX2T104_9BACL|nr:CDP-diacylglycerol--serine O-phosphatidyltransferase [Gemella palaticanis]MBF0715194.1 CDP-diacylglycerol--serine O-phosphatidyltransferase [Gemella palaticanis]NYS47124.1 CDP-diacylglycerol--serine O-phosphatidyltransferase [Gemella palaticanis]
MNKEWIPNSLTMANGFFGFVSIIMAASGNFLYAAIFIILSMIADRYDGIVARKLNIVSEIGKELDSICDVISFGVAPAFLIFSKINSTTESFMVSIIIGLICSVYVCCGAFRLARFNVKTLSNGYYQGVPITTCGALVAVLSMFKEIPNIALIILIAMFSYLMVSNIKIKKI